MKKHNGMRPLDLVVLRKIVALGNKPWLDKDLAIQLKLSKSAICESLHRSSFAGLLATDKKVVDQNALFGFLIYGLKYTFPVQAGTVAMGKATGISAPILRDLVPMEDIYVWPELNGPTRGLLIEPLYPGAIEATAQDPILYDLLSLCDVLRMGKPQELTTAIHQLKNIFEKQSEANSN